MATPEEAFDFDTNNEPKSKKSRDDRDDRDGKDGKEPKDKGSKERPKAKGDKPRDRDDRGDRDERDRKRDDRDDRDDRDAKKDKKPKGKKPARDEDAEPRHKPKKLGDRKVPFPPPPTNVPEGLTDYAESYTKQQNRLLAGLFLFLILYIGMILFFLLIGVWCVWSLSHWFLFKVILLSFSFIFFLYLVKGFFKSQPMNKEMHIEITEDEHPVLFEFIYQLCDELGAPLPNKVFVSPDVNAAVMPRTSLLNLFVEPKKDLLIGLGLVNSVNLSEFKAVLAHEFGHFSQSAMASSYTYVANRIIGDLVEGEDWFDRMVDWCKKQENAFAVFGYAIGAPLWLGRKILESVYKAITLQRLAVSREREFHADLVAVSAAGSNAVVHCLLRTEFGHQCFIQALNDMATALDHKLYSNDMYLHQDRASVVVRRKKKEPNLGMPPLLKAPTEGKDVEVFDPEEEEMTDEIPPMWRTHPSNSDREKNAKEQFVPAIVDNRSPWILFDDPAEIKERMTYKFYRMVFKIPKNADLADAVKVQKFIDNEHADTTYDPKYKGAYDDRPLEPGDISELNGIIKDSPWTDERMEKVLDKLYDGCEEHAEAHSELYKEMTQLRANLVGRPSPKMKRKMEEIEKKQDENWEWFKSFDRRVYLLHVQMALQVDKELKSELVERYRFQLDVQRLYQESRAAFNKADAYLSAHDAAMRGQFQPGPEFIGEVLAVLRESWKALKNIIKDAKEINVPALKNFEEGENLAGFILEGKMVPEPPLTYAKGAWINKLMTQLQGVRQKCFRLHFKSLGGILRIQEEIAAKWKALREPVAAEVFEPEPVAAEVIPAEVIAAEVLPAEVVPAEVLPAEIVAAEVVAEELPPEPLPAAPAPLPPAPEPPKAMAAFVAPPAPVSAPPELHAPAPVIPAPVPPPAPPAPVAPEPVVNPFDFSAPAPAPAAPVAEAPPPAPLPEDAVAQTLALGEAPAPTASSEVFSLDAAEVTPAEPVAKAPESPAPAPAKPVAADEVFSLDAAAAEAEVVAEVVPAAEMPFSLDADDHKPAPKPAEPKPASAPVPAPAARTTPAEPAPSAPGLSGSVAAPAPKPGFGSGVSPALGVKPANGKRPAIRITMVRPGEKSPLSK